MDVFWYCLLGALFGVYLTLDGTVLGAGMLLRAGGPGERARRATITSFGPFFLANEVWLVVTVATFLAVLPRLEGPLFRSHYHLVAAVLVLWTVRDAAVWFRSRLERPGWRRGWDRALTGASGAFAVALGLLVGNVVTTTPGSEPVRMPLGWYPLLWALTVTVVLLVHGATFLVVRLPGDLIGGPLRVVRRLAPPAAVLYAVLLGAGLLTGVPSHGTPAVAAEATAMAALAVSARIVAARPRIALALTALAAAAPAVLVGLRLEPAAGRSLAVASALDALGGFLVVVIPLVLAVQVWTWWAFLRRIDSRTPVFF
ncbi:cytochrome d ubiquinol oxidase subunit II [Microbispora sp. NPDC046933]|uniref:cytochrome d ubiquinol oxidase subunit II n=1 Tax=Microbispora sp. NPDC046933 TaxID=3155618 RepID=UPI0033F0C164